MIPHEMAAATRMQCQACMRNRMRRPDSRGNRREAKAGSAATGASVVQDDVEEGTVDAQVTIVVNEAQLAELIQKEIDP